MQSDSALTDIRASLEDEKSQLLQRLAELGFGDGGSLSFDQNFADSSQVTAERAEVEALATSLQDSLAEVEHALRKFDEGSYGQCESCGQTISLARLEAKPAARFCIDCASRR
jgi:RNA polymerase-binding transcription factor DksA